MSPAQQRGIALWAALLSGIICLSFLPVARLVAVIILVATLGLITAVWYAGRRRVEHEVTFRLDNLPDASYRQSVVLVCGDLPLAWPQPSPVITVTQGCWVRVEDFQDLEQIARQILWQRPDWGRQLSVMVSVCPQKHVDTERLTSSLLALRWQVVQLRKEIGHAVPLVLKGQVGSAMMNDMLWQAALPEEGVKIWRTSSSPGTVPTWVTASDEPVMQQQVLMNSLMSWFHDHVEAVFSDDSLDVPTIAPAAVLWGMGPVLAGSLESSAWTAWLSRHTAMQRVAGWQPVGTDSTVISPFPDFILPLLPEGRGLTPRGRIWRYALGLFTLAALTALLSSGLNNRQLLQRVSFDIARYDRIPMYDYGPKAESVAVLWEDVTQLDHWARNGVPVRMSLGLYQGEYLRLRVLDAIRSYVRLPPPKPERRAEPVRQPESAPHIIRLDSLSLFDSGT
ncbi:OmpA family protein, partial [Citrobacter sp. JGM124]|uniref:OmpA family protein n=1 Tax=Citrobacter sp. JGM124 TaxID=2799789 RepID=UPI001BA4CFE4